jgi:hypothetical protein
VQSPKKIHLATRAYLEGWAVDGLLRPISIRHGRQKLKAAAAVGWRHEWWGPGDPTLNRVCEESCGKLETVLPEALATVELRWPLEEEQLAVLAQFIALHVLRTEAFVEWFAPMRDSSLAAYRDRFRDQQAYDRFRRRMRSDRERGKKLLSLINKLSTLFGSMHWTLVRFDEPLLITGDQPVCPVPILTPGVVTPIAALPAEGWLDTCEIRCPLTPRLAVLLTWYMAETGDVVPGTWEQAVNLNSVVARQAVERYFQTPEREPAMAPAIYRQPHNLLPPLSLAILPGYSMQYATDSPVRQRTREALNELIQARDHETITMITSETKASALSAAQ